MAAAAPMMSAAVGRWLHRYQAGAARSPRTVAPRLDGNERKG